MIVRHSIEIPAKPSEVWDALTNPAKTKQYMFGCEVTSDFTIGGVIDWVGEQDGNSITYVHGRVQVFNPPERFSYTAINPNPSAVEQKPENYTKIDMRLESIKNGTKLYVSQGDFDGVDDGKKKFEETKEGWKHVLEGIKALFK